MIFFLMPSKYNNDIVDWLTLHNHIGDNVIMQYKDRFRPRCIVALDETSDNFDDVMVQFILTWGDHIISRMNGGTLKIGK